jgi:exopolysaccharide biosynthesis polyprenyl glycosylphosphotransferase
MLRERIASIGLLHLVTDAAVLTVAFVAVVVLRATVGAWWPFDVVPGPRPLLRRVDVVDHVGLIAVMLPVWLGTLAVRGRYTRLPVARGGDRLGGRVAAAVIATLGLLAALYLLRVPHVARTVVVGFGAVSVPALAAASALTGAVARRWGGGAHHVRIVGGPQEAEAVVTEWARRPEWRIEVVDRWDTAEPGVADGVDEVVVVGAVDPGILAAAAAACEEVGVALSFEASFLGTRTARADLRDLGPTALLTLSTTPQRGFELALKRLIDVIGAATGLAVLGPVMLIAAALVRWSDGGPAFYVQQRVGRHGRAFSLVKIRTMVVDADARLPDRNDVVGPAFKLKDDPRITRVGRWLRRLSIDELPQLLNVLRGEMSLVGPRPPLPSEVDRYARWQRRRLSMRPGLTGLWQVTARGEPDFDRWIALDLAYIDRWSLWLDVTLLVRTVPAVLSGRGAS